MPVSAVLVRLVESRKGPGKDVAFGANSATSKENYQRSAK